MAKQILYNEEARSALKRGIDAVADAIKITIGPRGRNVVFDKGYGAPTITNDGATIAKNRLLFLLTRMDKKAQLWAGLLTNPCGSQTQSGFTKTDFNFRIRVHEHLNYTA